MPKDIYEIETPHGVIEIESEGLPDEITVKRAIRAATRDVADSAAADAQARIEGGEQGGAVGRYVSGVADVLNPVAVASGMYNAVRHPIDTGKAIVGSMTDQAAQAADRFSQGRYLEAAGHAGAAALPIVGPMAAEAGEQIGRGDVAGGLGKATGLLAPFAASEAIAARSGANASKAASLERQAAQQVSERVLAPGNARFKGKAASIAPEMLKRGIKGGREELAQMADEGMSMAAQQIDDAIQQAGGTKALIPVPEVEVGLRRRIQSLQDSSGKPLSDQAGKRIAALRQRLDQVRTLGGKKGVVTFEDLKKIRDESYRLADEARGYEKMGNPAMADEGWAAREMGGAIRDVFSRRSPATAQANAEYSFWKTMNDVLDPVQGRPKSTAPSQGVTGGARTVGAVIGNMMGSKMGAFVMSTVLPKIQEYKASTAWQMADAQSKMKLADAIRKGNQGEAQMWLTRIGKFAPRTTSPNGSQIQTTEPAWSTP